MPTVSNFETLFKEICNDTSGEEVSVEDLLQAVGQRSFGPILLLLGFVAASPITIIPGATWIVSVAICPICVQILFGFQRPWIPKNAQHFKFKRQLITSSIDTALPWARQLDRFIKPRFTFLTRSPFLQFVALICLASALITFPLGLVPFGPLLPSLAIMMFGLALTARDGVVLLFSMVLLGGSIYLLIRIWSLLVSRFPIFGI